MRILNPIKIIILALAMGFILTVNTYAGDLEITMDVVKQSDAESIMDSITREITLPKGDLEVVEEKHTSKSMNDAMGDGHHMDDHMSDVKECSHQMRDNMTDAIEDSHHMSDHMNEHMNEHMNDAMGDGHHMDDHMKGSMR